MTPPRPKRKALLEFYGVYYPFTGAFYPKKKKYEAELDMQNALEWRTEKSPPELLHVREVLPKRRRK